MSFSGFFDDHTCLSDLPESSKPTDGAGILINVMGKMRWQPFATGIIKLLSKCLTDGTLYVEGIINVSIVSAACSLLCYGDADMQMACFDFARIVGSVMDCDIIPFESIILSIAAILREDKDGLPSSRSRVFDSSIGVCLDALHSSCPDDVIKLTAEDLMNVFPQSMCRTKSQELKLALCNAYTRIARLCPPHIWRPESLIHLLCVPEPCSSLIDCFQVVVSILGPEKVGGRVKSNLGEGLSLSNGIPIENSRVGEKRHIQDVDSIMVKRRKVDKDTMASDPDVLRECILMHIVNFKREEEYADYMHTTLLSFLERLRPPVKPDSLRPDVVLTALGMLCIAFCRYPATTLSICIFQQMLAWIPWICGQARRLIVEAVAHKNLGKMYVWWMPWL